MSDSYGSDCRPEEHVAQWVAEAARAARRSPPGRPASGPSAPEDLAQETLVRMLEHPPARGNAGAWIERICRNLRVDGWRAQARSHRAGDSLGLAGPVSMSTGEETLLARERRRVVRRALVSLPRPLRRALILRFFGGRSFDQIGERLGLPEATARTRVHRALIALRARVAALRVVILPQLLPLKGALAVAIVLAADPRAIPLGPRRVLAPAQAPVTQTAIAPRALAQSGGAPPRRQASATVATDPVDAARPNHATHGHPATAVPSPLAVKRYDFDNDVVEGDFPSPVIDPIVGTTPAGHASLIEIRPDFQAEIIKTLENL